MRFLDINLRVLRFEVSVYSFNIRDQFQTPFAFAPGEGGGGIKSVSREVTVNVRISRRKALKIFVPITSKNSASGVEGTEGCCEMGTTVEDREKGECDKLME